MLIEALLLTHPAGASVADEDGNLPLHLVGSRDDLGLDSFSTGLVASQVLLQANPGALMTQNMYGRLPLHMAVANCAGKKVVETLLEACPLAATITAGCTGRLPLHLAVCVPVRTALQEQFSADIDVVKALLLAHPAAASIADQDDCLPLHLAAESLAGLAVLEALLSANPVAPCLRCSRKGHTPQQYAEECMDRGLDSKKHDRQRQNVVAALAGALKRAEMVKRRGDGRAKTQQQQPDKDLSKEKQLELQQVADRNAQLLLQELKEEGKGARSKKKKKVKRKKTEDHCGGGSADGKDDAEKAEAAGAAGGVSVETKERDGRTSAQIELGLIMLEILLLCQLVVQPVQRLALL